MAPGLLFVGSSIIDPTKTSEEKYNHFYNEEHLPAILAFDNQNFAKLALRHKNVNRDAKLPYLALYPLPHADTMGPEMMQRLIVEMKTSETFDGDDISDYVQFDLRKYEKIQTYEAYQQEGRSGKDRGETIVCVAMEPKGDVEFDEWYRKQHLDMMGMCKNYRRCTRYKRMDDEAPRFLALHEYGCKPEELPGEQIKQVTQTEWSKKIVSESKIFERNVFHLIEAQGNIELSL